MPSPAQHGIKTGHETAVFSYLAASKDVSEADALAAAAADFRFLAPNAPPECSTWLGSPTLLPTFNSQFGQDATIYYSMLAGKLSRGTRGFYVDIGANDPREISNTWFLDRCLGWNGICIEADPGLANALRTSERTCKVVNKCAAETTGSLPYVAQGSIGHVAGPGETANAHIDCAPLSELLRAEGVSYVDFLSIDIEGNEVRALSGTDWDAVPIQLILAETVWSSEFLDVLLSDGGYWRMSDIGYADDLYIKAPRLRFGSKPYNDAHRKANWDWTAGQTFEGVIGRCIKRMGTLPFRPFLI